MGHTDAPITYNFEYERKLRVCYIGAGDHSFRNVLPTFQYAPVDLLAICDRNVARAEAYARQFGARRCYGDHREMLAQERPDAIFIVTAYHPDDGCRRPTLRSMRSKPVCMSGWKSRPPPAVTRCAA